MNKPSREKTGSLLVAGFAGTRPSPEIKSLIRDHSLGGVILYGKNCIDPDQVRELVNSLQEVAREAGNPYPLLVAMDQEQGRVVRLREGMTLFPPMGAIARFTEALRETVTGLLAAAPEGALEPWHGGFRIAEGWRNRTRLIAAEFDRYFQTQPARHSLAV